MNRDLAATTLRRPLSFLCVVFLAVLSMGTQAFAQAPPAPPPQPAAQLLSPDQLETLVAPIALYPDPLLGQVLAASTYPLEVVEAGQWLQQNGNLRGAQLMDAAKQQNWDPSVQALVAFPDVLSMFNRDVRWTTDLGNAFLAQQNDVMSAVQRMRLRAMQNGKLRSSPQQNVTTQTEDGQSAVEIEPADPQVVYVPAYNPEYVWGPPAFGYYPPLWYPGIGLGFGFGPGIFMGGFFPGWGIGWGGWGLGWGWGCGWFGHGLFVNSSFFNHYGFRGGFNGGFNGGGRQAWQHDAFHRAGVAYGNQNVASRFNNSRFAAGRMNNGASFNSARTPGGTGWRSFNNNAGSSAARGFTPSNRAGGTSPNRGFSGGNQSYGRNYSNSGSGRSYAAPNYGRSYSSSGSSRSYSAPNYGRSYSNSGAGSRSYSAPRSSGGGFSGGSRPSSGGFGGGHSYGGGGGHSSGGGGAHGGGRR